jgi:hypothetical protein
MRRTLYLSYLIVAWTLTILLALAIIASNHTKTTLRGGLGSLLRRLRRIAMPLIVFGAVGLQSAAAAFPARIRPASRLAAINRANATAIAAGLTTANFHIDVLNMARILRLTLYLHELKHSQAKPKPRRRPKLAKGVTVLTLQSVPEIGA